MSAPRFSLTRVGLIAGSTLREIARQRLLLFWVLLALALVVGGQWLRELNFGSAEMKFLADFGFGALAMFGAVLAIVATTQLFFGEIETRSVQTLLAKPLRRSEFVVGKLLGVLALLGVYAALMTALVALVLWLRQSDLLQEASTVARSAPVDFGAVVAAGFAQWLKLSVLASLTLLVASFARTAIFTVATGFLVLVICHLQAFAQTAAAHGDSMISRTLASVVSLLFPDFQVFDLSEAVLGGHAVWSRLAQLGLYAAGYVTIVAALTVFSFRKREL